MTMENKEFTNALNELQKEVEASLARLNSVSTQIKAIEENLQDMRFPVKWPIYDRNECVAYFSWERTSATNERFRIFLTMNDDAQQKKAFGDTDLETRRDFADYLIPFMQEITKYIREKTAQYGK